MGCTFVLSMHNCVELVQKNLKVLVCVVIEYCHSYLQFFLWCFPVVQKQCFCDANLMNSQIDGCQIFPQFLMVWVTDWNWFSEASFWASQLKMRTEVMQREHSKTNGTSTKTASLEVDWVVLSANDPTGSANINTTLKQTHFNSLYSPCTFLAQTCWLCGYFVPRGLRHKHGDKQRQGCERASWWKQSSSQTSMGQTWLKSQQRWFYLSVAEPNKKLCPQATSQCKMCQHQYSLHNQTANRWQNTWKSPAAS